MATVQSSEGSPVRPLGHLEKWSSASHMHGVMLNVCYGALLTTDDASQLPTHEKLTQAMQLMCQRRPMLCASIFDDDNATAEWRFLPAAGLAANISAVISISNDTLDYDEQLRKLTVTKVTKEDGNELLWKLAAHVPKLDNSIPATPIAFRITLVAHHALLDGNVPFLKKKQHDSFDSSGKPRLYMRSDPEYFGCIMTRVLLLNLTMAFPYLFCRSIGQSVSF